jgi:hypothetical protein
METKKIPDTKAAIEGIIKTSDLNVYEVIGILEAIKSDLLSNPQEVKADEPKQIRLAKCF